MPVLRPSLTALSLTAFIHCLLAAQSPAPQMPDALKQADQAFHAGYAALEAGNLQEARAQFAQAARLAPGIPEGHRALGEVLAELGKPAEAVPELQAALNLRPGDEAIEANLAEAYAKAGDPASALLEFSAAYQASERPGAPP